MKKALLFFLMLMQILSSAQTDKTVLHEKEMLKQNRVQTRKEYYVNNDSTKTLRCVQEFDRNGNLVREVVFNSPNDTNAKTQFIYNEKGQLTDEFYCYYGNSMCSTRHNVYSYSNEKLSVDSTFDLNGKFIHRSKYIFDNQGRDSIYLFEDYKGVGINFCNDSVNSPWITDEFGFVHDTIRLFYRGDTLIYTTKGNCNFMTVTYSNNDGYITSAHNLFCNRAMNGIENYVYDSHNNKIARYLLRSDGTMYWKDEFIYKQNNLLIEMKSCQISQDNFFTQIKYEYTYY